MNTPKVGDAATYTVWTDAYACTVIKVSTNGKRVTVQRDKAKITNLEECKAHGMGWPCEYEYSRDPEGEIFECSLRNNGVWKRVGVSTVSPGGTVQFGFRKEYYDPSF